jgi:cyclopropane fatty-acyl-phospholipid synthase-like methyltransferase
MSQDLGRQKGYWDKEVQGFDSIYSHSKSRFKNWLDAMFRWDMYARFDYTMQSAAPIQGRSFLDVGCGTGLYVLGFARRGAHRVVGIDISEKMLEISRQRVVEEHLDERCQFLRTDLLQYQPDAKFDVCIGIGLFDYIRKPLPVLTKMQQVVQDRIIISLPRFWTWRAPVRKVRLALKGCDVFFYTKNQIDSLLKQAGFRRYTVDKVGQLYCITAYV